LAAYKSIALFLFIYFFANTVQLLSQSVLTIDEPITVAIDCNNNCDYAFIKQEIKFVNHVRLRQSADVYIYPTFMNTGAGGQQITLYFTGQNRFEGINDTLNYMTRANIPFDDYRKIMVKKITLGLVRYVNHSSTAEHLSLNFDAPVDTTSSLKKEIKDKWNYWVFETNANSWGYGETSFGGLGAYGSFSASRTSKMNKYRITVDGSYEDQWFLTEDDNGNTSREHFYRRNQGVELLYAKGINQHWTVGSYANYFSSIFTNIKSSFFIKPTVEYSIFPYVDANSKSLTLQYSLGVGANTYIDSTIYDKINEKLFQQSLTFAASFKQKWGSLNTSLTAAQYLHDFEKYSITLGGWLDWNVAKGLSVFVGGNAGLIRDRIALVKGDISNDDLLLRRRQLASGYQFYYTFGANYIFGSNNNNVVNPRMSRSTFNFSF